MSNDKNTKDKSGKKSLPKNLKENREEIHKESLIFLDLRFSHYSSSSVNGKFKTIQVEKAFNSKKLTLIYK